MTDTTTYDDLKNCVENDPDRTPAETETAFNLSKARDRLTVHTAQPSLMRKLLAHPEFELQDYETTSNGGTTAVTAEAYREEGHDGRKPVYSINGTMPIGVLKVQQNARKHGGMADVVTDAHL